MRRNIRRSLRTPTSVHRRVFRPVLGWLEARTLLSGNRRAIGGSEILAVRSEAE